LLFADVIIPLHLPGTLTYGVPVAMQGEIKVGSRVEVSVGKNKLYAGLVWALHKHKPEHYQVKPIKNIIDELPIINTIQQQFWQWIAQYYLCSLGEIMNAALPAYFKLESETLLLWNDALTCPPLELSDDAFVVAEALHIRKQLTIQEVKLLLENKAPNKAINELLEQGIAFVSEVMEELYKPKTERYVFLHSRLEHDEALLQQTFDQLNTAPKQAQLFLTYFQLKQQGPVTLPQLLQQSKLSAGIFNALLQKEILYTQSIPIDRLLTTNDHTGKTTYNLSTAQQLALNQLQEQWQQHTVCLLQGVTGSGKTLLYIELIKAAITNHKQALYLLPEIALTTQVLMRLKAHFGDELGVYHSRISNNERIEIWNKVKSGAYKVIVGPRSALWLPFLQLQYIIVDEEHETSYKQQEPAPRFHARDAAIYLGLLHRANIVLGSATPSLESAYNVQQNKYGFVKLQERYNNIALPTIEVVPAKNIHTALSSILTTNLIDQMVATIAQGKQVLLFQNKRGYAPFLLCGTCGWVAHCNHCDVSLTYHKATDKLHCHYCGNKSANFKHCPQCHNPNIVARNFGTEKVEEELQRIFPKLKVARMDWDSVKGKNKMQQLLQDFDKGRIDILVGTQMIVKGLDFENVGLVGILSADSLLSYPDFRVNERGYQLMEQVSGRAGRVDGQGLVVIQAHNMQHPALSWVSQHSFNAMYHHEIIERQQFQYPPFCRMIKISCKHRDEARAATGVTQLSEALSRIEGIIIQGPAPALVSRVRNYYIQEIRLKLPRDNQFNSIVKDKIAVAINTVIQKKGNSALQIICDVDPY
jgi:primosomal protein N' (replication factor Y)